MKTKVQLASEYQVKNEVSEAVYNELRDSVGNSIRKAMQIKLALANLELKLGNANAEFEQELLDIENSFKP